MSESKNRSLHQLVKGAGITFILGMAGYFMMFFFRLFTARYFGPEGYGVYTLLETIKGLFLLFAIFGVGQGITRFVPYYIHKKDFKALEGYMRFIFRIPTAISITLSIFVLITADKITLFFGYPAEFSLYLRMVAFIFPFHILSRIIRQIFLSQKKVFFTYFSYEVIQRVILLLTIFIIYILKLSLFWLILGGVLAVFIPFLLDLYFYLTKLNIPRAKKSKNLTTEWLIFSLPLFFMGFFAYFVSWTDNLIIGKYLPSNQLGIYAAAFSLAFFLSFFQRSFGGIFLPLISENYAKKLNKNISFLFRKSAAWIFGLTFPVFLILVFYAKHILSIIFGQSYTAGRWVLIIISIGVLLNISTGLGNSILILHKKTKFLFGVNVIIAALNVLLNILLIPVLGIVGPAIASAVSLALREFIILFKAMQYEKLSFDYIYNLKFIISGIPAILIAVTIFRNLQGHLLVILFISGIMYLGLYTLFLLLLKTFRKDDFEILLLVEQKFKLNLGPAKKIVKWFYMK